MNKKTLQFIGISFIVLFISSWTRPLIIFQNEEKYWVDSIYQSMSFEEKLGQLFMVAAYSNKGQAHKTELTNLIVQYKIGGLIFFQGGPKSQIEQTNYYQYISKTPLLIAMDAEWGVNMRLKDSTLQFPHQMTLGAIQNNDLIYEMGKSMAEECTRLGVHINFAPVVDINVNPNNPVIGTRSFGENKFLVAQKGIAITKGMQDYRVIAVAKHFPGHGDTDKDSHLALPIINHDKKRLYNVEVYPFQEMFSAGVKGVMVAHLQIPVLDNRKNRATTLSYNVVTKLLQNDLKYEGLIFTDALNMKGVSEFNQPGIVDEMAFLAGNDVLLFPEDVPKAIQQLKLAYQNKKFDDTRLELSVKKILRAKYWAGLSSYKPISSENVYQDLNNKHRASLIEELYAQAITVVRNDDAILPIQKNKYRKIACIQLNLENDFGIMCQNFDDVDVYSIQNVNEINSFLKIQNKYDLILVGIGGMNNSRSSNYGISSQNMQFLTTLNQQNSLVLTVFGNPYSLKNFDNFKNLICAYNQNLYTLKNIPQVLFGARKANGKLPVSASSSSKEGTGIDLKPLLKLGFSTPEAQKMNSDTLQLIDSIVKKTIEMKATPGCQILIARNGKIIYQRNFGFYTYDSLKPIHNNTVYDLASITKVASTMQAVMKLYEENKLDIHQKASFYLPELRGTNKENLIIKDILLHQAGLAPFIPHWSKTIINKNILDTNFYCFKKDSIYCCQVSGNIYCKPYLADSVWKWTIQSELIKSPKPIGITEWNKKEKNKKNEQAPIENITYEYKYSDLGFYIMKAIVEKQTSASLDNYIQKLYDSMGLDYLTYNPLNKYSKDLIAPTEEDNYFRNALIEGYVHDQGAAMLGGVGGHAGLFSNAYDLAQLMQMNLQNGYYDGKNYFANDTTIAFFTKKQVQENRRGLGWDKPFEDGSREGSTSYWASSDTYGHSGFTGTCAWVDPKYNLVYIFLSNRVYPDANNKLLYQYNIRTKIHDVIYQSMDKKSF